MAYNAEEILFGSKMSVRQVLLTILSSGSLIDTGYSYVFHDQSIVSGGNWL